MNKTFCSDLMQSVVFDCMRVVGVNALDRRFPMAKFYREAAEVHEGYGVIAEPG